MLFSSLEKTPSKVPSEDGSESNIPPDPIPTAENNCPIPDAQTLEISDDLSTTREKETATVQQESKVEDLTDPQKFQLDLAQPSKKRITKADFLNRTESNLEKRDINPSDPFGSIDPLWGLKK